MYSGYGNARPRLACQVTGGKGKGGVGVAFKPSSFCLGSRLPIVVSFSSCKFFSFFLLFR